jgi:hypothetical protein
MMTASEPSTTHGRSTGLISARAGLQVNGCLAPLQCKVNRSGTILHKLWCFESVHRSWRRTSGASGLEGSDSNACLTSLCARLWSVAKLLHTNSLEIGSKQAYIELSVPYDTALRACTSGIRCYVLFTERAATVHHKQL